MITNIVSQNGDDLTVSSDVLAEGMEIEHRQVIRAVRDNIKDLERFGRVDFQSQPFATAGGMQVREIAHLTEHQATFLLTSFRNIGRVKEFKVKLVEEFYRMRQALAATPALSEQEIVHQALQITVRQVKELEAKVEEDAPKVAYVDRFVGQVSDAITVDVFASQFGSTGPTVRALLQEKNVAVRKFLGERWSPTKQQMEKEFEWRPRQGVPSAEWFDLRPQHNAPRLHNGQVRQTMYVRQYHAQDLAAKLGLEAVA